MRDRRLHGTIWMAGRNYVTSLPKEWGEKIEKQYNSQIEKIQFNDKVVITPPFDPFKKLRLQTKADSSNKAELRMKIVSAYLQGYDEVGVEMDSTPSRQIIAYLSEHTVPGLTIESSPDGTHYTFAFLIPSDIFLPEVIKQTKVTFHSLYNYVSKSLASFPELDETNMSYVGKIERQLDNTLYKTMRYLNKALSYSDIFEKIGLKDDRSIIHLNMAFSNIERLGDLHEDIIKRLRKISNLKSAPNLKPFLTYYEYAYETIPTSIDALEDTRKGFEIIKGKISEPAWSSYKNGALLKSEEAMKNMIYSLSQPELIRHLTILEGKLEAIPDASSNICEQAWNKDKETLSQELYKQDIVISKESGTI